MVFLTKQLHTRHSAQASGGTSGGLITEKGASPPQAGTWPLKYWRTNCLVNLFLDLLHAVASGSCIRAIPDTEWLQVFGWSLHCTPFWTSPVLLLKDFSGPEITLDRCQSSFWTLQTGHISFLKHTLALQADISLLQDWLIWAATIQQGWKSAFAAAELLSPCSSEWLPHRQHSQAHSPQHTWLEYQLSPLRSDVCSLWLQPLEAPPAPHLQGTKTHSWEKLLEQSAHKCSRWAVGLRALSAPGSAIPSWKAQWAFSKSSPLPWCCSAPRSERETWFQPDLFLGIAD